MNITKMIEKIKMVKKVKIFRNVLALDLDKTVPTNWLIFYKKNNKSKEETKSSYSLE